MDRQIDRGELPAPPLEWTVRENRWLASRYGMDASVIVEYPAADRVERRSVRELVTELVDDLRPIARELGSERELDDLLTLLEVGSGTERQRRVLAAGGTLADVVHHLAAELEADRPLI